MGGSVRARLRWDRIGPLALAAVFIGYLVWSWGKWPDALIDFGRELYVPWQLSEGQRLYADIAYFNGPLSPTFNGLLFRLFGTGLRTLVIANIAVLAMIAATVHTLLRMVGDRLVAVAGTLALIVFFAFAQFQPGGNYNYLAPYSHEATHGTALALVALLLLAVHLRGLGGKWVVFAMGVALGLTFLTKAEFVIALVPALVIGLALHHRSRGTTSRDALVVAGVLVAGALIPPAAAFALLSGYLPAGSALKGTVGPWAYLFDGELRALRFYRDVQGTLDLGLSMHRIGTWILRYAAAFSPAAIAAVVVRRGTRGGVFTTTALALLAAGIVLVGREALKWEDLATPWFPLLTAALAVNVVSLSRRRPEDDEDGGRRILALSCLVYALALLLKILLNVRILHYGFVLAMPAGMALIAILLGSLPAWLDRRGRNGSAFRAVALAAVLSFGFVQIRAAHLWLGRRTVEVGVGTDRFLIHDQDAGFRLLLDSLDRLRHPGDTLLVVPEGVMLNYLLRMRNPTGHVNFMPPELIMFGESGIREAFERGSPDWVVLINHGAREYGYRMFGDDYGRSLVSWIELNYHVVDRVQESTPGGPAPFAAILRRNP